MSKYLKIETTMTDPDTLSMALDMAAEEHGFKWERREDPANLYGYHGQKRSETAGWIIRRSYVGMASNDIGWATGDDGKINAVVSAYDKRNTRSMAIVKSVNDAYTMTAAANLATAAGYTVTPIRNTDGKVVELALHRY